VTLQSVHHRSVVHGLTLLRVLPLPTVRRCSVAHGLTPLLQWLATVRRVLTVTTHVTTTRLRTKPTAAAPSRNIASMTSSGSRDETTSTTRGPSELAAVRCSLIAACTHYTASTSRSVYASSRSYVVL